MLSAAQLVAPSPELVNVPTGGAAVFDVVYSTIEPENAKTTGLSFRMHYRSSELIPDMEAITTSAFPGATIQDTLDAQDFDNDLRTDRFINVLWFDVAGNFPVSNSLPLRVVTATFATTAAFDGESVGFTGNPPAGFEFTSAPATLQVPQDGDVDGDGDFDANDSFLILLVSLSGTNSQIDPAKGSSLLSSSEIREKITSLELAADVDGDEDFDANDAFLIHLVKLSGTDVQIDQAKGSSSLTAAQIRSNVAALDSQGNGSNRTSKRTISVSPNDVFPTTQQDALLSTNPFVVFGSISMSEDSTAMFPQVKSETGPLIHRLIANSTHNRKVDSNTFTEVTFRDWIDSI